jgi:hypothetical protein
LPHRPASWCQGRATGRRGHRYQHFHPRLTVHPATSASSFFGFVAGALGGG